VPYVSLLDNWQSEVFDLSFAGIFRAYKLRPAPSPASLKAAQRKLARMRLQPVELVGRLLPRQVCGCILRSLPNALTRRLTLGKAAMVDQPK
jgi:hypothetical protein